MGDETRPAYQRPTVDDYGDLGEITALHMPLAQAGGSDLAFSSPSAPNGGGGPGLVDSGPPVPGGAGSGSGGADWEVAGAPGGGGDVGGEDASGGSGGGGGGSDGGGAAGGGGGGGDLPFTGFAAGVAAAIGTGMTVAGGFLRKALRGRRS